MVTTKTDNSTLEFLTYVLTYYLYTAMLILGSIGNILNIILFFRKKLRVTSCNNYFLAAAFTNLIALNVTIGITLYTNTYPDRLTTFICKIESYLMNACLQMSRYLILMACIDRYALCSRNAGLRRFCHVRIARRYVIPSIILIWFIIPLHVPIYSVVVNQTCTFIDSAAAVYNTFYGILMIGIIPPVLMCIFTILIFRNLKLRQRRRQIQPFFIVNHLSAMNQQRRSKIKDQQVLLMLVMLVIAYVISSTPYTAVRLYLVMDSKIHAQTLMENDPTMTFVLFLTDILRFICPFISFYLFISISHLYRKEMRLMFCSIQRRCCQ